jgi:hypothetical protein
MARRKLTEAEELRPEAAAPRAGFAAKTGRVSSDGVRRIAEWRTRRADAPQP